ncbi:MAG: amidohydrolase family protein [Acidimicrobiia bacterium]|nr:amidohydrolase family protein [Acidimicrobiia bacterium]
MKPGQPADLIVHGGTIVTVDRDQPEADHLIVRGGRIVAMSGGLDEWVGPGTDIVDLDGRMVLPGFQDSHVHPPIGGLNLLRCNLANDPDRGAYLDSIRRYADDHPEREWILGGGWGMDHFPNGIPTRDELDRLVADRPVFLVNRDGHGAWVNSKALELAGIGRHTDDPADGRIERDAGGDPIGCLQEGAMDLVERLVPETTDTELQQALTKGQSYLLSLGITAWQDAWVTSQVEEAYRTLAADGSLKARVVGALWWERDRGEEQIEELQRRRARGPAGRFKPGAVKIMLDGVAENFTAALLEPYRGADGRPTKNAGLDFIDPSRLGRYVARLDAAGFQVHFHAIGDRAVRNALDAVDQARRVNGASDHRHHIAHLQLVHPDDIPRFRLLDVVANAQPFWAVHEDQQDHLTAPFLGPHRSGWQYPWHSLVRSGARLAFGSDWSVSTPNPLAIIETAVRRVSPFDRAAAEFYPEERLDLGIALQAATRGSAYVNHLDHLTGTLVPGKLADFVVLDRDIRHSPVDEIADAGVEMTFIEGECVYEN